jgi:hypothetical protein
VEGAAHITGHHKTTSENPPAPEGPLKNPELMALKLSDRERNNKNKVPN